MGGGLLQLVAYGAQDVYLTGNPQITFFKVVYRRHTNFAMESIRQSFNGTAKFGNSITCQISRNGDLINRVYVEVSVPRINDVKVGATDAVAPAKYVNYLGLRLLKSVVIEIGGQQIDKHYADWLYIWNELSLPVGKRYAYDMMVGADSDLVSAAATKLYVPLEFWFCRNVGLALPLIALQYHEVKLKIEFETLTKCVKRTTEIYTANPGTPYSFTNIDITDCVIWVDYIFLDTDERRRFAQLSHEYLIEQLQFTGLESLSVGRNRIKLNFNHPCKELVWVAKKDTTQANQAAYWYNYTTSNLFYDDPWSYANAIEASPDTLPSSQQFTDDVTLNYIANLQPIKKAENPFNSCLLQLNGNDRFAERNGTYFNLVQAYQHHTNIPMNKGINVYSFALKPEEHQPSGTLNMSRIDTAVLSVDVKPYYYRIGIGKTGSAERTVNGNVVAAQDSQHDFAIVEGTTYDGICIYAVNYNVLRILSGMGGLAYSN
jgi:hypothetical protein